MNNIGIIDADLLDNGTSFPNLALMKISGYEKQSGSQVTLLNSYENIQNYDKVYVSKVFTKTDTPEIIHTAPNVVLGGTGFFDINSPKLPTHIEHHMPDYTLYQEYISSLDKYKKSPSIFWEYFNASIGFTTRGCFRKCPFCVNRVYDKAVPHSPVSEFFDPSKKYIVLLDDNFLACSSWRYILQDLNNTKKPFVFKQGLDIRLINKEKAELLSSSKYKGSFIFAFDNIEDRPLIEPKLKLWREVTHTQTEAYVLVGFYSQDSADVFSMLQRVYILRSLGIFPYIMRHQNYSASKYKPLYNQMTRFCNQPSFCANYTFRQFAEYNQTYRKYKPGTICQAMRALLQFQKQFPESSKYFDQRMNTAMRRKSTQN